MFGKIDFDTFDQIWFGILINTIPSPLLQPVVLWGREESMGRCGAVHDGMDGIDALRHRVIIDL